MVWVTTNPSINFVNSIDEQYIQSKRIPSRSLFINFKIEWMMMSRREREAGYLSIFNQLSSLFVYQECSIKRTDSCSHNKCNRIESQTEPRESINRGLSTIYYVESENRRILESYINIVKRECFAYLPQLRCELRIAIRLWLRLRILHLESRIANRDLQLHFPFQFQFHVQFQLADSTVEIIDDYECRVNVVSVLFACIQT